MHVRAPLKFPGQEALIPHRETTRVQIRFVSAKLPNTRVPHPTGKTPAADPPAVIYYGAHILS